jgi:alpha-galactosidase
MSFIDLRVKPAKIAVQTDDKWVELKNTEEGIWKESGIEFSMITYGEKVNLRLRSLVMAIKRVKIRWNCIVPSGLFFLGDHWERGYGDLEWRGIVPERVMPWYFLSNDGTSTHGYGVKTGPNAMCFWQVDPQGVTLWMDVRCGAMGVQLGDKILEVATIVTRKGKDGESALEASKEFCRIMCENPRLPSFPVYGGNNWYYAYGNSSHEQILEDTRLIVQLADGNENKPFMVIDDGWQVCHNGSFNGGPWNLGNYRFPDMAKLAEEMKAIGARPGIWMRPLLTVGSIPKDFIRNNSQHRSSQKGMFLDPSVPGVLELVASDIKRIVSWGYELIKHDFSTYDIFGRWGFEMNGDLTDAGWSFADKSKTTAEIILGLYRTIREAAGNTLIIGCNTISHLSAGIFEIQRTGDDTSGVQWERTRKYGINTLAFRMCHHDTFYAADADCVGLTKKVPWELNKQWLELLAKSGTPLFVSAAKEAIGTEQEKALKEAFKIASKVLPVGEPLDWLNNSCPSTWKLDGEVVNFDWYGSEGAYLNNYYR